MNVVETPTTLMLVRILVGILVLPHGLRLVMRPKQPPRVVQLLGLKPLTLWAALVWGSLLAGGVLLILGLVAPLGSALVVATMMVAASSKKGRGYFNDKSGCEYPMVLGILAALLGLTSPSGYSLDAVLGLQAALGPWPAVAALAVVLGGGAVSVMVYRLPADGGLTEKPVHARKSSAP